MGSELQATGGLSQNPGMRPGKRAVLSVMVAAWPVCESWCLLVDVSLACNSPHVLYVQIVNC